MRAIAERLGFRFSAAAPPVGARLQFYNVGRLFGAFGGAHWVSSGYQKETSLALLQEKNTTHKVAVHLGIQGEMSSAGQQ